MHEDRPHPWQDAADEFKTETLAYLKLHGLTIGAKSGAGDALAQRIVANYKMIYRSFDPITFLALKEDLAKYEASR